MGGFEMKESMMLDAGRRWWKGEMHHQMRDDKDDVDVPSRGLGG